MSMNDLVDPALEAYLNTLCPNPLAGLDGEKLDFSHPVANMSCGPLVGNLLQTLVRIHQPKRILELGTMLGYSALCMAQAMPDDAVLVSIEKQADNWQRAVKNCTQAGFIEPQVQLLNMPAMEFLHSLEFTQQNWNLVFLDADKLSYHKYYEILIANLPSTALLIVDNVLFRGELLQETPGKIAQVMAKFNQRISKDPRVDPSLIPMRDGLYLIRKK